MDLDVHTFKSDQLKDLFDSCIKKFEQSPVCYLPPSESFLGTGVYGLYYTGNYELYSTFSPINKPQCQLPIYVGKAVPSGWRQARTSSEQIENKLYHRLGEHSRSIECTSLSLDDFRCRFLILNGDEANLIGAIESSLIRKFTPLWNSIIDGFGNHDPGSGRYNQSISEWDSLHAGRQWATRLKGVPPDTQGVKDQVCSYFEKLTLDQ